jgi:drug/metabolite transporter (DMT)-like permease
MTASVPTAPAVSAMRGGLLVALVSAVTFGSSGTMAKALITAGWSPGAAVLVRLSGGALVLLVIAAVRLRSLSLPRGAVRVIVAYGVIATAGTQLAYFNAVQRLDVAVALMLEFSAPVLLLAWSSLRSRRLPTAATLAGAVAAVAGLVLVLEPWGVGGLDLIGVGWGLLAAVLLATFFTLGERARDTVPVLVLAAGGTAVGAVTLLVAGLVGVVPIELAAVTTEVAGRSVSWVVPVLWLAVVATAVAYLTGIAAVARLGQRVSSFVALSEVLAAVLIAWAVLAERPGLPQLVGGAVLVAGIAAVQRGEQPPGATPSPAA